MTAHTITNENYGEALDAIRDILLLYVDMAESYSGFGHATDVNVRFDPLKFVDAELINPTGYAPLVDIAFLRTGSAVAILCSLYDEWCEFEAVVGQQFKDAIQAGRLRLVPDIDRVAREALERGDMRLEDPWFDEAVEPIYQRHVVGYFEALSKMHRREGGDGHLAK
ncbi:hypothetical protein [uncultured Brevundimonas sp.]|uniref:hypothetical protein n=1 Tax=uncultured Brevundimonas sp. TaxID=213418 RepID=UPI00261069EC|nr:hypothetical protein [uncultured Brevundimonas sp.]